MLYPRIAYLNDCAVLVDDTQMTGWREHMTQEHRMLYLEGQLTGEMASNNLMGALDSLSDTPIKLFITSPGGELDSAFLFYDTMKMLRSPAYTIGRYCASAAAMLLAAGEPGHRYLYPHAKVMLHLPSGMGGGDSRDWDIQHAQMKQYRNKLVDILIECGAKRSREELLADMDRDYWLEPQEAISYGLADKILTPEIWQEWIKEGDDATQNIPSVG
jgi:ATP-dependent Clp protease protease subunit